MAVVGFELRFNSRLRGPISSGQIYQHVDEYESDVARELAEETEDTWLSRLHGSLRHQTPHYTTQISKRQIAHNRWKVHDNGVVYGHWLEGTGSRNSPVTRFPGYHALEFTEGAMQARRSNIARKILRQHRARGRLT